MSTVAYRLSVGNWSVSSSDDPKTELIELATSTSLRSPGDYGRIVVYAPPRPAPGLLEQAVGAAASAAGSALGLGGGAPADTAFSVEVRGQKVKLGDKMKIDLTVDDKSATVLTADVVSIESAFGETTFTGRTGMQKLANSRVNQVYQNQSLGQIVQDLGSQAGVDVGDVDDGNSYAYFVAHESKTVLRTIRELAEREGMDLYFDSDDHLTVKKFTKTSADHTLYYGIDLLDLEVLNAQPSGGHVVVSGESPASGQGSDTWSWLARDVKACQGEVGQGTKVVAIRDGAVRTKDSATAAAIARLGTLKDQSATGRLKILGRPALKLGDAVELKNVPKSEMNGLFKVTAVRHMYTKQEGYVTDVGFSGQGGAASAQDLLGKLGGALSSVAGGLGL